MFNIRLMLFFISISLCPIAAYSAINVGDNYTCGTGLVRCCGLGTGTGDSANCTGMPANFCLLINSQNVILARGTWGSSGECNITNVPVANTGGTASTKIPIPLEVQFILATILLFIGFAMSRVRN